MKTSSKAPFSETPKPRGRKRDPQVREAILKTLIKQIQTLGYSKVTIDGLAKAAKVGRMTIYRWWKTKADIALEAADFVAESAAPFTEQESLELTLQSLLSKTFAALQETGALYAALMSESQSDPDFAALFYERFVAKRRQGLEALFRQAQARGEIADTVNPYLLVDLVYGPMWYRLLLRHAPLDENYARALTQIVMRAAK
ncbi:MAG: TetR/AcrR family transcriptional regulator [Cyanobacteria bacterium P01_A01_bin.123]